MMTTLTTRIAALTVAVLLTVVTNGSMLLGFDAMAQEGLLLNNTQTPHVVKLDTVTIVAKGNV